MQHPTPSRNGYFMCWAKWKMTLPSSSQECTSMKTLLNEPLLKKGLTRRRSLHKCRPAEPRGKAGAIRFGVRIEQQFSNCIGSSGHIYGQ